MMTCMITDESFRRVQEALQKAGAKADRELKKAIKKTALLVQGDARKSIQAGGKTGTTYYRISGANYMTVRAGSMTGTPVAFIPGGGSQNLSSQHTASAPGEAPASDTGQLASAILIDIANDGLNATIFADSNRAKYAVWLEYGTRKIEPRPFLIPALKANRETFYRLCKDAIRKVTHTKED